jgi:hypothetical protein
LFSDDRQSTKLPKLPKPLLLGCVTSCKLGMRDVTPPGLTGRPDVLIGVKSARFDEVLTYPRKLRFLLIAK